MKISKQVNFTGLPSFPFYFVKYHHHHLYLLFTHIIYIYINNGVNQSCLPKYQNGGVLVNAKET